MAGRWGAAHVIEGAAVERLLTSSYTLGEGAVWSEKQQAYLHVDIHGRAAYRHDVAGAAVRRYDLPSMVGTIIPRACGNAVVALEDGFHSLHLGTGSLSKLATLQDGADTEGTRFNDGKASPDGRIFAGTMDLAEAQPRGSLWMLEGARTAAPSTAVGTGAAASLGHAPAAPQPSLRRALAGVTVSNGLAWTADGRTLLYIDSPTRRVDAFDYDPATGALSRRRVALRMPEGAGFPDGCCLDAADRLWVAMWGGNAVLSFDTAHTRAADADFDGASYEAAVVAASVPVVEVRLPASLVTSCVFGGLGLRDLYITTAKAVLTPEQRQAQPEAGDVFIVRDAAALVGVAGAPSHVYKG
jgi:sugar lactone lactonase YvrE